MWNIKFIFSLSRDYKLKKKPFQIFFLAVGNITGRHKDKSVERSTCTSNPFKVIAFLIQHHSMELWVKEGRVDFFKDRLRQLLLELLLKVRKTAQQSSVLYGCS